MTVVVRLFAFYAERFGHDRLDVSIPAGATVADVVASLRSLPGGVSLPLNPLVAVNSTYASDQTVIHQGDEIALIPPVAGG